MSTHPRPTIRIETDRPNTDDRWRDDTRSVATDAPTRRARHQFSPGCRRRLYNLIDDENRAMLD